MKKKRKTGPRDPKGIPNSSNIITGEGPRVYNGDPIKEKSTKILNDVGEHIISIIN